MAIFESPYGDIALSSKSITEQVFDGLKDRPDAIVRTASPEKRCPPGSLWIA
jgi:hypothetical protein